jgi:hypothetical protein
MTSTNNTVNPSEKEAQPIITECVKVIDRNRTPDSPTTKTRKYNLYIHGGIYQGKKHYGGDYQGGAEYLSDQINITNDLKTPEEYEKYKEEIRDLDDDYIWSCF